MQSQAAEISDGEPCPPPKPPPHHIHARLYLLSIFPAIALWTFGAGGAKRDELFSPLECFQLQRLQWII